MGIQVASFELIANIASTLSTISSTVPGAGTSVLACGIACHQHESCGGFIFEANSDPRCKFVVDASVSGAVRSDKKMCYRLKSFRGQILVNVASPPSISWMGSYDECSARGASLIPVPLDYKERAQLSIRRRFKFFMDGKQSDDGSYTDSSGAVVSTAILNWDDGDPDGGNQKCLGGGYDVLAFFDYFCNNNLPNFVILCAM